MRPRKVPLAARERRNSIVAAEWHYGGHWILLSIPIKCVIARAICQEATPIKLLSIAPLSLVQPAGSLHPVGGALASKLPADKLS